MTPRELSLHLTLVHLGSLSWLQEVTCLDFVLQLALLTELSRAHGGEKHGLLSVSHGDSAASSVFQDETFQLHLAPPPLMDD